MSRKLLETDGVREACIGQYPLDDDGAKPVLAGLPAAFPRNLANGY